MKKLLLALLALVIVSVGVGFILPSDYRIERKTFIAAQPAAIHTYVGDLERWPTWNPFQAADPSIEITPGDKTTGVGASQSWSGSSGDGRLIFTSSSPERGVRFDLDFEGGQFQAQSEIGYAPAAAGTTVRWTMSGDGGPAPIGGYFALLTKTMVGGLYEDGLARLKTAVESDG